MGQRTFGLLYGVPEGGLYLHAGDGEGALPGLLDRWREKIDTQIDREARILSKYRWDVEPSFVPQRVWGQSIFGLWIALGVQGDHGIQPLTTIALESLEDSEAYMDSIARVKSRWGEFARWAATEGASLPTARIYLALSEIA